MFERTRSLLGRSSNDGTYLDVDSDFQTPQEVENPHTNRDNTKTTKREWIAENKLFVLSLSLLGLAVTIFTLIFFGRYFITFLAHPWTHRGLAALVIGGGFYGLGRSSKGTQMKKMQKLNLYNPDTGESTHFIGRYRALEGATHDVFVPFKGLRSFGHEPEAYRIGELSAELVKKHNHSPEEEAVIRLHPAATAVEMTDRGMEITQLTSGIEPDPFGRDSNLEASLPDIGSDETVLDLKDELEKLEEENHNLQDRNQMLERQRDNAIEEAQQARREVLDEIGDIAEVFQPFATGNGTVGSSERKNGDSPPNGEDVLESLQEMSD